MKDEHGNISSVFKEYEMLSFCRERLEVDRKTFMSHDTDNSGFIIFAEFKQIRGNKGSQDGDLGKQFDKLDIDGDKKLIFEEWDGERCQNFSSTRPPSSQTRIRLPCIMTLFGKPMLPGFNWNFTAGAKNRFSFSYYPSDARAAATHVGQSAGAVMAKSNNSVLGSQQLWLSVRNERSSDAIPSTDLGRALMRKENLPPCSLHRHTVSDEYSTLTMEAHSPPHDRLSLRGAWKGTCNPSVLCFLRCCFFSHSLKFISYMCSRQVWARQVAV